MRIKFRKGNQRKFFELVLEGAASPSLRELGRRIGINYQTLKNYYSDRRLIPEELFNVLCRVAEIDKNKLHFEMILDSWGQVKGGMSFRKS